VIRWTLGAILLGRSAIRCSHGVGRKVGFMHELYTDNPSPRAWSRARVVQISSEKIEEELPKKGSIH
jgi:hypothetical protein